jgi:nicotinate-nucleotide adenylyltransferase
VRLGIFGGTFDPPHIGHLIAAQDAFAALQLDTLRFVPAAIPPHKRRDRDITPAGLRLELVRTVLAGDDRFESDPIELGRQGPSFTVDTLRLLREKAPHADLVLLIGADQFTEFDSWKDPQEIVRLADVAVLNRAGLPQLPGAPGSDARIHHVAVTRIDVSSSEIRRRVRSGEPIRYLVPAAVEAVIRREGLYRR